MTWTEEILTMKRNAPRGIVAKILYQFLLEKIVAESPTALLSGDAAKKNYALRLANFSL